MKITTSLTRGSRTVDEPHATLDAALGYAAKHARRFDAIVVKRDGETIARWWHGQRERLPVQRKEAG